MATYKVIQDIEAEDKLVGPLTLKQFIYAAIAAVCLYLSFISLAKHASFMLAILLPPAALFLFFAFPFKRDQPTEIWALAKIRFLFKPRRRIWDQSGIKELVTITAPKKSEENYTNGLSQTEVKSRLKALADTIDSRGWAIKNININMYSQPSSAVNLSSDRLIDAESMPHEVPSVDITAADDILDEHSNPVAQHFDQMINASSEEHREQIEHNIRQSVKKQTESDVSPPNDYWFMNQPQVPNSGAAIFDTTVVAPGTSSDDSVLPTADEETLTETLREKHVKPEIAYSHLRTIAPLGSKKQSKHTFKKNASPPPATRAQAMTQTPDPGILQLASNNDLNVATLARQANQKSSNVPPQDEIVISLR